MLKALERKHPPTTFLLDTFFKSVEVSAGAYVDIDIFKEKRRLAPFVKPIAQGKLDERQGFTTYTFKPPYLKPKRVIKPDEVLNNRAMGDTIYMGKSPQQRAAETLMKDLEDMRSMVIRREEWMAAKALETGTITVSGDGYDSEIDFLRTAGHTIAVGTITAWTEDTAEPLTNLKTWKRLIQTNSGLVPDVIIMGYTAWDAFIEHASVQSLLDNRRIIMGQIDPKMLPSGAEYQGDILGMPIFTYAETYISDAGATEYYVPAKKIFMGSTRLRAVRHYAAIQDLEAGFASVQYFPKSWVVEDPSSRIVMLQSSPLTALHEPDATLCAEVVA